MMDNKLFEQRKTSKKWATLDQARQGIAGDQDNVDRIAKARMKAQEVFEKIRRGQVK